MYRIRPLVAGVVALSALGAGWLLLRPAGEGGAPGAAVPCGTGITVAASLEKSAVMEDLAQRFNRARDCGRVTVYGDGSGDVLDGLAHGWQPGEHGGHGVPEVWSPAASAWVRMLPEEADDPDRYRPVNEEDGRLPSVARTPVVLAMPETTARKLGWPEQPIGWATLHRMATAPEKWRRVTGERGGLKLGKTNPNYSTTGLASLFEAYATAHRGPSGTMTKAVVRDQAVRKRVREVESSAVHYGETTLVYLCNLARADAGEHALDYVSAVPLEEKSVYEYNQGRRTDCEDHHRPKERLVPVYPEEGTVVSDGPYTVLSTADEAQRALAREFLEYLHKPAQQDSFKSHGFRGARDDALAPRVAADLGQESRRRPKVTRLPDPAVLNAIRRSWEGLRKPARVLLVLDVSQSMGKSPGGGRPVPGGSRLDKVKEAATEALGDFADQDEVGLWKFSGDIFGDGPPHEELVPTKPMRTNRGRIEQEIAGLRPEKATALYTTIRDAHRELDAGADRINAVVVLTDGVNEYRPGYTKDDLVRDIGAEGGRHPVRVFTVAYTKDADRDETLLEITAAGGGWAYDSRDPSRIRRILREVVSNF